MSSQHLNVSSQHLNSSYTQLTSPPQGGTVGVFLQKQRCFGTGKMAKLMLDASVLLEEHRPQKLSNATKLSRKCCCDALQQECLQTSGVPLTGLRECSCPAQH